MSNLACRRVTRGRVIVRASDSRVLLLVSWAWLCQTVERFQASRTCRRQWAPPTLSVIFDLGHVLALA